MINTIMADESPTAITTAMIDEFILEAAGVPFDFSVKCS